jgi:hypothetical protein
MDVCHVTSSHISEGERNAHFTVQCTHRSCFHLCRDMFSEGNAAHPVGCDSPLLIVMAVRHTFFDLNLLEHHKGRKGTLRPDFQANQCCHKIPEEACKEIQV